MDNNICVMLSPTDSNSGNVTIKFILSIKDCSAQQVEV